MLLVTRLKKYRRKRWKLLAEKNSNTFTQKLSKKRFFLLTIEQNYDTMTELPKYVQLGGKSL